MSNDPCSRVLQRPLSSKKQYSEADVVLFLERFLLEPIELPENDQLYCAINAIGVDLEMSA